MKEPTLDQRYREASKNFLEAQKAYNKHLKSPYGNKFQEGQSNNEEFYNAKIKLKEAEDIFIAVSKEKIKKEKSEKEEKIINAAKEAETKSNNAELLANNAKTHKQNAVNALAEAKKDNSVDKDKVNEAREAVKAAKEAAKAAKEAAKIAAKAKKEAMKGLTEAQKFAVQKTRVQDQQNNSLADLPKQPPVIPPQNQPDKPVVFEQDLANIEKKIAELIKKRREKNAKNKVNDGNFPEISDDNNNIYDIPKNVPVESQPPLPGGHPSIGHPNHNNIEGENPYETLATKGNPNDPYATVKYDGPRPPIKSGNDKPQEPNTVRGGPMDDDPMGAGKVTDLGGVKELELTDNPSVGFFQGVLNKIGDILFGKGGGKHFLKEGSPESTGHTEPIGNNIKEGAPIAAIGPNDEKVPVSSDDKIKVKPGFLAKLKSAIKGLFSKPSDENKSINQNWTENPLYEPAGQEKFVVYEEVDPGSVGDNKVEDLGPVGMYVTSAKVQDPKSYEVPFDQDTTAIVNSGGTLFAVPFGKPPEKALPVPPRSPELKAAAREAAGPATDKGMTVQNNGNTPLPLSPKLPHLQNKGQEKQ